MKLSEKAGPRPCPVQGCSVWESTQTSMRLQFFAPAFPGHRGDTGRGKPPPPTVPSVKYAGAMAGSERYALVHRAIHEGSR